MTAAVVSEPCAHCGADVAGREDRLAVEDTRGRVRRFCDVECLRRWVTRLSERGH